MRGSAGRDVTYFLLAVILSLGAQGFVIGPLARQPLSQRETSSARRCRFLRLAVTPPRKPSGGAGSTAAGSDDNGAGFRADDSRKRITRAPLRITPNFQPQEKRRPKTDVDPLDITYGAFLTEQSFDIAAMAWAEFSDWLRRTIERNVDGAQFEFDIRQWSSSIRKWWSRAVEMDVQAKADLFRLYDRGMQERDAWGNQAVKVDARVEDEWDSIYVDCQDSFEGDSAEPLAIDGSSSGAAGGRPQQSSYSGVRKEGSRSTSSSILSALAMYQPEEKEEDGGGEQEVDGKGFDDDEEEEEEDIIDCAIRGRWTFENNDDPPHFSPQ